MANDQSSDVLGEGERAIAQRLIAAIGEFNLEASGIAEFHEMLTARFSTRLRKQSSHGQPTVWLTTHRCLPICRVRVKPTRSNISTVPLLRNDPETLR